MKKIFDFFRLFIRFSERTNFSDFLLDCVSFLPWYNIIICILYIYINTRPIQTGAALEDYHEERSLSTQALLEAKHELLALQRAGRQHDVAVDAARRDADAALRPLRAEVARLRRVERDNATVVAALMVDAEARHRQGGATSADDAAAAVSFA